MSQNPELLQSPKVRLFFFLPVLCDDEGMLCCSGFPYHGELTTIGTHIVASDKVESQMLPIEELLGEFSGKSSAGTNLGL